METKTFVRFVMLVTLITGLFFNSGHSAYALSETQAKGIYRHGIWEWSLKNCPDALRQKGYWFALKEVGGFESAEQITSLEQSRDFLRGWKFMAENAERYGIARTCDYAFEQWPAILYRNIN